LDKYRVNIEELDSHLSPAPTNGTTISSLKMKVSVPQGVALKEVKKDLYELAGRMNLDVIFKPVQE